MALSTDVNLPRAHAARFPDRCVVCGCNNPKSHIRIITGTIGWWTWTLWWFGKPFLVKAPTCACCAWKLHGRGVLSMLVTIGILIAVFYFLWPQLSGSVSRGLRKWAMMALALVCLVPQFLVEAMFARPFDVTAFANSVDYEFTSKDYAIEFAMLNDDAEWVKIDGEAIS